MRVSLQRMVRLIEVLSFGNWPSYAAALPMVSSSTAVAATIHTLPHHSRVLANLQGRLPPISGTVYYRYNHTPGYIVISVSSRFGG